MSDGVYSEIISFILFAVSKSYFSRITREHRKNPQDLQIIDPCEAILDNDDDGNDFHIAACSAEAHQLIDDVIGTLDDVILHQSN